MQQARSREKADRQHREILSALQAGNARRAASLLAEHWNDGGNVMLRWLADSGPASADTPGK
jgi:DNA-binding GntR family transcriptional regulator